MVSKRIFKTIEPSACFAFYEAWEKDALRVTTHDSVGKELLFGNTSASHPVIFERHMGRIPTDLMPGAALWIVLISDRFREVLLSHKFSGWRTYPVEVYGVNGKMLGGYHGLSITGRCGKIDESLSPIIQEGHYPTGKPKMKRLGLFFPPESWDGSDIFLAGDWFLMFCTDKVASALQAAKLTNVQLTRASEYRSPV